uniref:VASP tetramerisation domain-containing protein n=1 Tax=Panagrellus redivivus TaxID=6233 RepID=A0A7E4ZW24_PANRE
MVKINDDEDFGEKEEIPDELPMQVPTSSAATIPPTTTTTTEAPPPPPPVTQGPVSDGGTTKQSVSGYIADQAFDIKDRLKEKVMKQTGI